jgi:tRNA A37 N6-isopentenylltransferase MiaA
MHAEMHATQGMGMGPDMERMHAQMDEMHAEMWARLSPEDRARHQRMHEACAGLMTERTER